MEIAGGRSGSDQVGVTDVLGSCLRTLTLTTHRSALLLLCENVPASTFPPDLHLLTYVVLDSSFKRDPWILHYALETCPDL